MSRMTNDTGALYDVLVDGIPVIINQGALLIGIPIMMLADQLADRALGAVAGAVGAVRRLQVPPPDDARLEPVLPQLVAAERGP